MNVDLQAIYWLVGAVLAGLGVFGFVRNFGRDKEKDWNLYQATITEQFFKVREHLAALQVKVDTMWDFTLRRATSEAVIKAMGTVNSPIMWSPAAVKMMTPLLADLQEIYATAGLEVSDGDLALEIERVLGKRLLTEICIPNQLYMGACLLIAVDIAKGRVKCNGEITDLAADQAGGEWMPTRVGEVMGDDKT